MTKPVTQVTLTVIQCVDCGTYTQDTGQPKQVAKRNGWSHAGKGTWRCVGCSFSAATLNVRV